MCETSESWHSKKKIGFQKKEAALPVGVVRKGFLEKVALELSFDMGEHLSGWGCQE